MLAEALDDILAQVLGLAVDCCLAVVDYNPRWSQVWLIQHQMLHWPRYLLSLAPSVPQ
jgi:hypothetical protein